jgi:hypothetical protein
LEAIGIGILVGLAVGFPVAALVGGARNSGRVLLLVWVGLAILIAAFVAVELNTLCCDH